MRQSTVPYFSPCLKQDPERECLESIVLFREGTYRSFSFLMLESGIQDLIDNSVTDDQSGTTENLFVLFCFFFLGGGGGRGG